jgi:dienelactone hydrolase
MRGRVRTCSAAILLAIAFCAPGNRAMADEAVTFASARYLVGDLQQRLARERGKTVQSPPAEKIIGYLSRPPGNGPFPAIVHLHGCGGLTPARRQSDAEQFTRWGYVTLMVDSFATRGIKNNCLSEPILSRDADALGALIYLSMLPFVDPRRIAVVGYSQGGIAALEIASFQPADIFDVPTGLKFKAAVAYYPSCGAATDKLAIPTLVLIGELDDWTLAASCDRLLRRFDASGAPLKVTVFPEAYHSFDNTTASVYGVRYYGHWLRYNADVTARAAAETHDFLAGQLSLP